MNVVMFTLWLPITVMLMVLLRPSALLELPEIYRACWIDDEYLQWLLGGRMMDEEVEDELS